MNRKRYSLARAKPVGKILLPTPPHSPSFKKKEIGKDLIYLIITQDLNIYINLFPFIKILHSYPKFLKHIFLFFNSTQILPYFLTIC